MAIYCLICRKKIQPGPCILIDQGVVDENSSFTSHCLQKAFVHEKCLENILNLVDSEIALLDKNPTRRL